jgi:hypothetical protein
MEANCYLIFAVLGFGVTALIGFFWTKVDGYGRFTTSTLLILLVFVVSALLFSAGKLDAQSFANLCFAVIGFAGGLFQGREPKEAAKQGDK